MKYLLSIILLWLICGICIVFPPLGVVAIIIVLIKTASGHKKSGTEITRVHYSKITFPPCRPYNYEKNKDGMVAARPYRDKNGRIKYCCNSNHTHYY
jgi:hypothetical protein